MKRLSKNSVNLKKVADSICKVSFTQGSFVLDFLTRDNARLVSLGRDGIGSFIISNIPSNWRFRVSFEKKVLVLTIFI